jgi:hypothetical protein
MPFGLRLWHGGSVTIGTGKRPRDTNQLAKFIVDVTTETILAPDPHAGKNPVAAESGALGGQKAEKLGPKS